MSKTCASELSRAINVEARHQFPKLAKLLGNSSVLTTVAPRLALRLKTQYPYSFIADTSLLPHDTEAFGRVIKRSREAGLEEIHDSIDTQSKERSWLFVSTDELWVDTTLRADEAKVEPDFYAHVFLSYLYPEIESIHTHPDAAVRLLADTQPWGYSQNYLLEAAQPSTDDLIGHSQMVACTAQNSHQVGSVISHYGVTSFYMTNDLARGFRVEAYRRSIDDASNPVNAIRDKLGGMSAHVLCLDDTPAISVQFAPIQQCP